MASLCVLAPAILSSQQVMVHMSDKLRLQPSVLDLNQTTAHLVRFWSLYNSWNLPLNLAVLLGWVVEVGILFDFKS